MRSFYFFGYDSKLLRLGINEQVMSFLGHVSTCQSFCSLVGAVTAFAGAIAAFAGAIATCVEAVAVSTGAVIGIFG